MQVRAVRKRIQRLEAAIVPVAALRVHRSGQFDWQAFDALLQDHLDTLTPAELATYQTDLTRQWQALEQRSARV